MKRHWIWLFLLLASLIALSGAAEAKSATAAKPAATAKSATSATTASKTTARDSLNATQQSLYDILKPQIQNVAKKGGSTRFTIPADKFDYGKLSWTKAQLNVNILLSGKQLTKEANNAINAKILNLTGNVIKALQTDLTNNFYWYSGKWHCATSAYRANAENVSVVKGGLTVTLSVSAKYANNAGEVARGRITLNETGKILYDILKPQIQNVANKGGTTNFKIPMEKAITEKIYGQVCSDVLDALMTDLPYDLYWFSNENAFVIDWSDVKKCDVVTAVILGVLPQYQSNKNEISVNAVTIAKKAKETAQGIVKKYAGKSDYEKLLSYKNEICDLTSYGETSQGKDQSRPGGGNFVFVFDGDDNTKVVCMGYSHAFQYLCNLSSFNSPKIRCYTVRGGDHAWNIVTMEDGKNYLADITNCDTGRDLFLKGASGSVTNGYAVSLRQGTELYKYDKNGAFSAKYYSNAELTLADTNYKAKA